MHGAVVSSELLRQHLQIHLSRVFTPTPMAKYPKRISVIDHRTDGAIFAGINPHLNGLRLRFGYKDVFIWEYFAIDVLQSLHLNFTLLISRPWPNISLRLSAVKLAVLLHLLQRVRTSMPWRAACPNVLMV